MIRSTVWASVCFVIVMTSQLPCSMILGEEPPKPAQKRFPTAEEVSRQSGRTS